MAKRPIPHEVTDAWLHPLLTRREIRRDLTKYLRAAKKGDMLAAAEGQRSFDRPALVIWAAEDRVMPPEHGRRFAEEEGGEWVEGRGGDWNSFVFFSDPDGNGWVVQERPARD
jgi:hypothetical protein